MTLIRKVVAALVVTGCHVTAIDAAVAVLEDELSKPLEKRRKSDRERQRRHRDKVATQSCPLISLSKDSDLEVKKERKRVINMNETGDLFGNVPVAADDWPEDFADQFWAKWPKHFRKYARKDVATKLARVRRKREATWAEIWGGLCAYLATNPDPQFIPAPAVWVHQARWAANYDVVATAKPEKTSPMLDYAAEQMRHVREG